MQEQMTDEEREVQIRELSAQMLLPAVSVGGTARLAGCVNEQSERRAAGLFAMMPQAARSAPGRSAE